MADQAPSGDERGNQRTDSNHHPNSSHPHLHTPDLTEQYRHLLDAFRGKRFSARSVFNLTMPVLVDVLFMTLVEFCNTGIISSDGPASVSAVNTANVLHWLLFSIFSAIGLGGTVLVSQFWGAGDVRRIGRVGAAAIHVMLIATVAVGGVVLAFERPIVTFLFGAADADVFSNIEIFLFGLLATYPLRGLYVSISGLLRGIGRTRVTLVLSLVANGCNMLFNFVFVAMMHLGVTGLAMAVAVSQAVGAVMGVLLLRTYRTELRLDMKLLLRPRLGEMRRVVSVSVPFALEGLFFNGGKLIIQTFIVPFGTLQIAANGIISSWIHWMEIVPSALGQAIVPIVGASLGARDVAYAKRITRNFVIVGSLSALVVGLLQLAVYPWVLSSFFHAPEEIHGVLWQLFIINLVFYPLFFPAQAILPATLRASGDGKYTTLCSLASMWIYRIGLGYVVAVVLGWQIVGLWVVWGTEWGVRTLLFYLRYRTGKWARHDLISA